MPNNHHEPASGTQFVLESGDYRAVVASVGATLRTRTHAGRNLVVPFDADQVRPAYRGASLAPWPNRIANGSYGFSGRTAWILRRPTRSVRRGFIGESRP